MDNSMEKLVTEGANATHLIPSGDNLDLDVFPNVDFYYKMVAKTGGRYYSIYDAKVEYEIGTPKK